MVNPAWMAKLNNRKILRKHTKTTTENQRNAKIEI